MANKITFDSYLNDVIGTVQQLEDARTRIEKLKERHIALGFGSLTDAEFTGLGVTKAEYDAVVASFNDFVITWWATNRTALEQMLIETP